MPVTGEGAEEQSSPLGDLTPELAAALKAIRHRGELIFCNEDGSMMNAGQFHEVLWAAQKRADLRRITWHELRHSYASILVSGGAPIALIRGPLGHSSVKMTERYAHLAEGQGASYVHLLSWPEPENVQTPCKRRRRSSAKSAFTWAKESDPIGNRTRDCAVRGRRPNR